MRESVHESDARSGRRSGWTAKSVSLVLNGNALRQMLVQVEALPARFEYRERVPAWLNRQLPRLPEQHRKVVHVYVSCCGGRASAPRTPASPNHSAANLRSRVTMASRSCGGWMNSTSRSPMSPRPWPTSGSSRAPCTRRGAKHFLDWAAGRGLAPELDVQYLPSSEPDLSVTNEVRWALLCRCLHDATLPLEVRSASGLVLLCGFPVSRISELTADDVLPPTPARPVARRVSHCAASGPRRAPH